jgi:hypothetical protein
MNQSPEISSQESNFRKRKLAPKPQTRLKGTKNQASAVRIAFDKPSSSSAPPTKSDRTVKKTTGSKRSKPN